MVTLLLIFGSVICVLLYRSLAPLLRQIPDRNEDFDICMSGDGLDRGSLKTIQSRDARHFKIEVVEPACVPAIVPVVGAGLKQ